MAAPYKETVLLVGDTKQFEQSIKRILKGLGLIQRKARKLNQTSINLGRVRTRSRNIKGTGRNTSTNENRQIRDDASPQLKRQITALNNANKALNKYVQDLSKADTAQRGFAGSTNKINTQVSALRDRLKGLTRSNSEYRSTLQAVQRGEQALFEDRNKRLRDQANSLGRRGEKGGTGDLVTSLLNEDVTQSIDGLNNYVSRLNTLRDTVKINSTAFKQLSQKIVQVNEALEKTEFKKPQKESKSSQTDANRIKAIEEQRANIIKRINESSLGQAKKNELINNLKRVGVELDNKQLALAKQINTETQRNLTSAEKNVKEKQITQRNRKRRRNRIIQSGLIGGGFPLLFGGGLGQSLAGGIGGLIGEARSPGGGFAGSIAATAVIATISKAVNGIGELGKALNPFTADINKLTKAVGLAGTAEGERLRLIEQLSGKQEALKVATAALTREIGQGGVQALKTFGKDFQGVANEFNKLLTNLGATIAKIINATGIMDLLQTLLKVANKTFKPASKKLQDEFGVTSEAGNTIKPLFTGKTKEQEQQIEFLENSLRIGEKEAKNRLEIAKHYDQIKHTLKANSETERQQLLTQQQQQLNNLNRIDQLKDQLRLQTQIKDVLAVGMTNAIQGLILGTQTLSQSLSNIAKQLGSIFLNRAFGALFSKILFPGPSIPLPAMTRPVISSIPGLPSAPSFSTTPGLPATPSFSTPPGLPETPSLPRFAYGGVVSSPTLGMIGEGGEPEYVIPSSKMDGAMARYSAGARGGAVIPGGSGASGTVAGSSGNTIVEYTGPVLNFNGDEYVPKDSVPQIINAAAKQGATLGQSRTLNTLKNSRSSRAKIGI